MTDLHTHTTFSDGANTPEEMVQEAIARGLDTIGFSDHAYAPCDDHSMKKEVIPKYKAEIARLKEKYKDKIQILCGIEQDYFSTEPVGDYDFVIGSSHYVRAGESYIPVDWTVEKLMDGVNTHFGGDIYALLEAYYAQLETLVETTGATIVGHFDLVMKNNDDGSLFDTANPRYKAAWKKAADSLLQKNIPFEINYGGLHRGYRTSPYPAPEIQAYLMEKGAKFTHSSDSHSKQTLGYGQR